MLCTDRPLSSPERLPAHTPAYTCPEQADPPKGRGDGQLSPESQLGQPERHSQKSARRFVAWVEVGEGLQKSGSRPASRLERTKNDIRGTPTMPWCGKEGAETPRCGAEASPRSRRRCCSHCSEAPHTAPARRPGPIDATLQPSATEPPLRHSHRGRVPALEGLPLCFAAGPPNLACVRPHPLLCLVRCPFSSNPKC